MSCRNFRVVVMQSGGPVMYKNTEMLKCSVSHVGIRYLEVRFSLWEWARRDAEAFVDNFHMLRFKGRYASDAQPDGNPFQHSTELDEDNNEWQRRLLMPPDGGAPMALLCCPEDVERSRWCTHPADELCGRCRIPICDTCARYAWTSTYDGRIPMALANDNYFGYGPDIIARYKVRWIEAAIVCPCWTNMLIYYVEGDYGHLMTEEFGQQRYRTVVRGGCMSFHMPWEDILQDLKKNCADRSLSEVPHPQECLKYMLRVHMTVAGRDFGKHLRQVMVRPFVLVLLLDFLIGRNHEVFRGKGSAAELRERMAAAVAREYPETEAGVPEAERDGTIPPSVQALLNEQEAERRQQSDEQFERTQKRQRLLHEKNATPGDGATRIEDCLEDLRPQAMCMDKSASACTDPATLRHGALERYGELHAHTGGAAIPQWESKYLSQVMPFVIPYMVSGPDFNPAKRWRRNFETAPWVSPRAFATSFGRRVEAQCRTDWTALPLVRSVVFQWEAEHTMSAVTRFTGKLGSATDTYASALIAAAQTLYDKLHNGFVGTGVHRVPIAGDMSRLPHANGLSALEKQLAWASKYLCAKMAGTQALRRVMGHMQFGARVEYGDCVFATTSPNPQHSALVLRLSRFRRNDPFVVHGGASRQLVAGRGYPPLEATRRTPAAPKGESNSSNPHDEISEEADVIIDLPEYSLRRAYTAQDPHAIIEGYNVEIYFRLALILGVRMCPNCPNCERFPCQDKFGSNMRPGGGVVGGVSAIGAGTEHQGVGVPHLHMEFHVASVYQFGTLAEVVNKLQAGAFSFEQWQSYQEWLHAEHVFDETEDEKRSASLEQQWHSRFSDPSNHDLAVTPAYLMEDAQNLAQRTVADAPAQHKTREMLRADGQAFKRKYFRHVQGVFSRLQHHMHKKTKKGFIPLKSCLRKGRKFKVNGGVCKADFPKQHLLVRSTLVCKGVAQKLKLRISGRRNAFGSHVGKRSRVWHSATTPSFAAAFQSNSHTLPNWRLPPMQQTHDDELCQRCDCYNRDGPAERELKVASKVAQRAQGQCTGHYCGYTFKSQPVGAKFQRLAANSLNYLNDSMKEKTPGQQWHRITHRVLVDLQHRCMRRTAPEEWNLASGMENPDVTKAEFFRTFRSRDFNGLDLIRRLESEQKMCSSRTCWKVLPARAAEVESEEVWLRQFTDLYGLRGANPHNAGVFLLSPWEFLTHWERRRHTEIRSIRFLCSYSTF